MDEIPGYLFNMRGLPIYFFEKMLSGYNGRKDWDNCHSFLEGFFAQDEQITRPDCDFTVAAGFLPSSKNWKKLYEAC